MSGTSNNKKAEKGGISALQSIRTKLIAIMVALTAVPLLVAVIISYIMSTNKAIEDAQDSLEWQAWYIQSEFGRILDNNIAALNSFASGVQVIEYVKNPDPAMDEELLVQMRAIDEYLADNNNTVITGGDGMQLLRTSGDVVDVSERQFFKDAMQGQVAVSDIIISKSTGARQITIAVPIKDETGTTIGIMQRNYNLTDLHNFLAEEASDAFITDSAGMIAAHSQYDFVDGEHPEDDRSQSTFMTSGLDEGFYQADTGRGYAAMVAYVKEPISHFTVCCASDTKIVLGSARQSAMIVVIVGIILLAGAVVLSLFVANSFTSPIKEVNGALASLAEGRFVVINKFTRRSDELGEMIRHSNSVIDKLRAIVNDIKASASKVGDSSNELADTADQISQTADDVSNAVQDIASGATQQADEIQQASENTTRIS
ncbi:MAG: methyl-accepting chemotaxis protein, partial [Lachnospiraceae bacterium]|nr:methyl-accepting chemotaxis protein [Lachnospiraceae bacterium]